MIAGFFSEESPSTTRQECRVTPCEGDFKDSATEINRKGNLARVEMRCKRPQPFWRQNVLCKPHLVQEGEQMFARHPR